MQDFNIILKKTGVLPDIRVASELATWLLMPLHHGLLKKRKNMGLEGHLLYFIQQFLLARHIQVRNEGVLLQPYPLLASVSQGAVSSPTLFNIMINDLLDEIPKSVEVSQFADDGALWIAAKDLQNYGEVMQDAMKSLENFSHT